jgi:hypothetical protein
VGVGQARDETTRFYLDKGFARIDELAYLTRHDQRQLIACPIWGKTDGTRALRRGQRSYQTDHILLGKIYSASLGVTLRLYDIDLDRGHPATMKFGS